MTKRHRSSVNSVNIIDDVRTGIIKRIRTHIPFDSQDSELTLKRVFYNNNKPIYELLQEINTNRKVIFRIKCKGNELNFDVYTNLSLNHSSYERQVEKESTVTDETITLDSDIIGHIMKPITNQVDDNISDLADNIDFMDFLFTDDNNDYYYYINYMNEARDIFRCQQNLKLELYDGFCINKSTMNIQDIDKNMYYKQPTQLSGGGFKSRKRILKKY